MTERDPHSFRTATRDDVPAIVDLVNGAYRGDRSRRGWTTEADLLDGLRTDADEVAALIEHERSVMLLCECDSALIGTVLLQHDDEHGAYLGMLVIDPDLQANGLGKRLMSAAEDLVRDRWRASKIWMTVLTQRTELIAYYERRGYRRTGEHVPFPSEAKSTPLVDGLVFEVLEKPLAGEG